MDNNFSKSKTSGGLTLTFVLGGLVYVGVIVVSVVLTAMFITGILPQDAYALRFLMTLAVGMVGLNAIALPMALHFWCLEGWHKGLAIAFYAMDMTIIGVNMVVSFSTLSGSAPAWVEEYTPYSVGMLVFALCSWGCLKVLDPGERANLELRKAQQEFKVKTIQLAAGFLDSAEGHATIAEAASNMIPSLFNPDVTKNAPRSWYANVPPASTNVPPEGARNFLAVPPAYQNVPPEPVKVRGNGHK